MSIKAIETIYNGYRFRSRLEARWAVFFDALEIKYEYELEGFDLAPVPEQDRGGGYYLPDFYLPQFEAWLEVKGKSLTPEEEDKCVALHYQGEDPVLVGIGEPYFGELLLCCHDSTDSSGGLGWWDDCEWMCGWKTDPATDEPFLTIMIGVENGSHKNDRSWLNARWEDLAWVDDKDNLTSFYRVPMAGIKARQARFEYGETP